MEINGNILSTDNLRPIFDLLARDHADRVKVTDFVNLLRDHLNISDSDILETTVQQFNTDSNGYVMFSEFCSGVQKMSNSNFLALLATTPSDLHSPEGDEYNCRVPSDVSTYNEYDIFTDDDQVDASTSMSMYGDTFSLSPNDSRNPFHEEYVQDLSDKVVELERELEQLTVMYRSSDESTSRLKEENSVLTTRIHTLEDMLEDLDLQTRSSLEEETARRQQTLRRLEKEKSSEVDILTDRLQLLERDYSHLSEELPLLKADNRRLTMEVTVKQHEVSAVQAECDVLMEANTRLRSELDTSRQDTAVQLSIRQQLIEELTRELDDMRHRHGDYGRGGNDKSVRRQELEQQLVVLKEENAYLREQNEDLEDQLNCMNSGRSLWINGAVNQSLADEIEGLSSDELITALKDQQRVNDSLRQYIDTLTVRVLEVNPTLLEVTAGSSSRKG